MFKRYIVIDSYNCSHYIRKETWSNMTLLLNKFNIWNNYWLKIIDKYLLVKWFELLQKGCNLFFGGVKIEKVNILTL